MAFDIQGARQAGYSDGEIAAFLGQQSGFDVEAATKAGYAPAEIVGFLAEKAVDRGPATTDDPLTRVTPSTPGGTQPTFTTKGGAAVPGLLSPDDTSANSVLDNAAPADASNVRTRRSDFEDRQYRQSVKAGKPGKEPLSASIGANLDDAPMPVRAIVKASSGAAQGAFGLIRAGADLVGADTLADVATGAGASGRAFDAGMGDARPIKGFGPKSPLPYLKDMSEGAASSLIQSAVAAGTLGAGAVIPAMSLMTAGQEYDKARQAGLDPMAALAGAIPKGIFEAIGEKFTGLDKVASAMGTLLQRGATAQAKRSAGEVLLHAGIREVPGEVLTYLGQSATDILPGIGLNQGMTMRDFVEGLRDTVVQSSMMGAAVGGGGALVRSGTPEPKPVPSATDLIRTHWGDQFIDGPTRVNPDPVSSIMSAPTVDDAIAAAQSALSTQTPASADAVTNIERILGTEPSNVSNPLAVTPELGGSLPAGSDISIGGEPDRGLRNDGPAGPVLDPAAGIEQGGQPTVAVGGPASGAYPVVPVATMSDAGTLHIEGDPNILRQFLAEQGITATIPTRTGLIVGRDQSAQAQAIMQQFQPAANASIPLAPGQSIPNTRASAAPPAQTVAAPIAQANKMPAAQAEVPANPTARYGVDGTDLAEGGKPFKTKDQAKALKKLQPMMRVIEVQGGFALTEKTAAQLAAEEASAKRLRNPRTTPAGDPISAHAFIASEGGLSKDAMADAGFDRNPRIGNRYLFARQGSGMSAEDATQKLIEWGYLPDTASINDAMALIKKSVSTPQYTPEGWERIAAAEQQTRFEDHLTAQSEQDFDPFTPEESEIAQAAGYNDASAQVQTEFRALIAAAEAEGIDTEAILEDAAKITQNGTDDEFRQIATSAIEQARTLSREVAARAGIEQRGNPAQPRGAENGDQVSGAQSPARSVTEEGLTAPTRADVLAQDKQREEESQRQKDGGDKPIEKKVTADTPDMFNTQGSVFDAPEEPAAPTEVTPAKPASEMSAAELLRAAADKIEKGGKAMFALSPKGGESATVKRIGDQWAVVTKPGTGGEVHHGYFASEAEATTAAADRNERNRPAVKRARGDNSRWWTESPTEPIQSAGLGRLDSVGRARAVRETINAQRDRVRNKEEAKGLQQIEDRAGYCFPLAAQASAAGLGDMVIGSATDPTGSPIWHAVVMRGGMVYDPTFGKWFAPGVYESLGFQPEFTLTTIQVQDFIEKSGGSAPDAKNQGLGDTPDSTNFNRTDPNAFRRAFEPANGMTVTQVRAAVDKLSAGWKGGPKIIVVARPSDLPVAAPPDALGMYRGDTVWIVASTHTTNDRVARTLGHEAIAHYGLRAMLGADGFAALSRNIQFALASGNKPFKTLRAEVRARYVDKDGKYTLTPAEESDEIAARAVEHAIDPATGEFRPGFSFLKQAWAKIAEFLRSLGITVKFTNVELQGMLVASMKGLRVGRRMDGGGEVMVAAAARAERDSESETELRTVELESVPGLPLVGFRDLPGKPLLDLARRDAEKVLGFQSPVPVMRRSDVDLPTTPMYYDLDAKAIIYNTGFNGERTRSNDAQWMVEEMLHAADHIGGKATLSLGSDMLRIGGEIRSEIEAGIEKSAALRDFLRYPLEFDLAEDRMVVELFARLGVLYKGFPELLQAAAPNTFKVYHEIFTPAVQGQVRRGDAARDGKVGQRPGDVGRSGQDARGGSQDGKSDRLEDLRARIAKALQATPDGVVGEFDNPQTVVVSGDQTDTPEFKRFFGDSKVVDAAGRPLVVYHGTGNAESLTAFDPALTGKGNDQFGSGFYFTSRPETASGYTTAVSANVGPGTAKLGGDLSPGIIPVYLSIKKPIVVHGDTLNDSNARLTARQAEAIINKAPGIRNLDETPLGDFVDVWSVGKVTDAMIRQVAAHYTGHKLSELEGDMFRNNAPAFRKALHEVLGYDGVVKQFDSGEKHYVVWFPEQIKSAIGNNGEFDPTNQDIRFARGEPESEGDIPNEPSAWRDATGRLQFAPGQWLYDKIGEKAGPMLNMLGLKAASPELRRQLRQMKLDVQKAQDTAVAVAKETAKLSDEERKMVSDIIEQELRAGVVPPAHAVKLAGLINATMERQTDELVELGMLTKDSADRWRGKYLPRYYENKLGKKVGEAWADAVRRITGRQSAMKGIKGKHLKGRGLYETIPADQLKDWQALGWEVRDPDYQPGFAGIEDTVQVWRDFTREERDNMGEIRDSGFRFVMGYMESQRDIALGRMFDRMAKDPASSSRLEKEGYVQVPNTIIEGTGAKRYGNLAGRWVPMETMSQLSNIEESQSAAWQMYRKALGLWKESKTVLNPVSHVNNIVSNLTMAHLAGVSYHRGDKYVAAARDFLKKTDMLKEAKENGLFLGTLSDAELMNSLPEELKILAQKQESTAEKVGRNAFNVMSMFLRKPMGAAYQAEDTFFRYLIYKDAREHGLEPQDAVDYAQKYIFTYDDLPKGARRIRDLGIPFFSYTYKAIPALLHTALTHPGRMAAPAAVLWAVNAAAYAIAAGGDDDDDWQTSLMKYVTDPDFRAKAREKEKLEREHLPPWMKGTTALATPRAIRLGTDELTKLPVFIDVSRIIPGGDLFDVSPNAGGIPWLQPFTPSNPLLTTFGAMFLNKDPYFGKEITDSNDTRAEAATKRADWIWKQFTPAIAVNNYHWERGMNALAQATGGEIKWLPDFLGGDATGIGRDGNPVQPKYAAMNTFGIKARPIDLDASESIDRTMKEKMIRDIDAEIRKLVRYANKGAIPERTLETARELARIKKDRLREGLTVDGDEKN